MQRLFHRQVQHFVDVLAAIAHFQHLRLVSRAFALFADQFHVGQKLHLHGHGAVALAGIAAASGDVEREVPRAEKPRFFESGSDANRSRIASKALI